MKSTDICKDFNTRTECFFPESANGVAVVLVFNVLHSLRVEVVRLEILLRLLVDHVGAVALQRQRRVPDAQKL